MSGAERGTAFHKVMEHIPFTAEGKSAPELADFIGELRKRNILTQAEAEAVIPEKIAAFFRSNIGRRVLAAETIRKEAPFTMRTALDGRDIMVQGTIDCCFLEDGEWVLVDYKSNYIDREHRDEALGKLKESYAPQLALYREALEKISGRPVKESILYLFGTDEELRIE
jgi:ATP-dependent helicase/nuclease subunit A